VNARATAAATAATTTAGAVAAAARGRRPRRRPRTRADARAPDTAGLPVDATPAQIRKRHRELVRKFHPDAQPHLGPVAQREATERFTAIQRAYETLTADGGAA
jgi:DnaJ-domain-containing protein 1